MNKYIKLTGFAGACICFGGLIASLVLTPYIKNQREFGYNNGYIDGKFVVFNFLDENLPEVIPEDDTGPYLPIKDTAIHIIDVDGVKVVHLIK